MNGIMMRFCQAVFALILLVSDKISLFDLDPWTRKIPSPCVSLLPSAGPQPGLRWVFKNSSKWNETCSLPSPRRSVSSLVPVRKPKPSRPILRKARWSPNLLLVQTVKLHWAVSSQTPSPLLLELESSSSFHASTTAKRNPSNQLLASFPSKKKSSTMRPCPLLRVESYSLLVAPSSVSPCPSTLHPFRAPACSWKKKWPFPKLFGFPFSEDACYMHVMIDKRDLVVAQSEPGTSCFRYELQLGHTILKHSRHAWKDFHSVNL